MIVTMKRKASKKHFDRVVAEIEKNKKLKARVIPGEVDKIIAVIGKMSGDEKEILGSHIRSLRGVEKAQPIGVTWTLASKHSRNGNHVTVKRGRIKVELGGRNIYAMPGPCSVENPKQMDKTGKFLSNLGTRFIRGGAFKPRSAPGSFEGLREDGLKILKEIGEKYGLLIVTELLDPRHAELFLKYVDVVQIGMKNGLNYELLKVAGGMNKPVLLKREWAARITDWLNAAEYILREQDKGQVILCERGIRTFETWTRNTLDLNAVPIVKSLSWCPVVVDPSHGIGIAEHVSDMARASIAANSDGLLIEVHPNPSKALTDGDQSLDFKAFEKMYLSGKRIAKAIGRRLV